MYFPRSSDSQDMVLQSFYHEVFMKSGGERKEKWMQKKKKWMREKGEMDAKGRRKEYERKEKWIQKKGEMDAKERRK